MLLHGGGREAIVPFHDGQGVHVDETASDRQALLAARDVGARLGTPDSTATDPAEVHASPRRHTAPRSSV